MSYNHYYYEVVIHPVLPIEFRKERLTQVNREDLRRSSRVELHAEGELILDQTAIPFMASDISFGGCRLRVKNEHALLAGMTTSIQLPIMGIACDAIVRWITATSESLVMGLEFQGEISSLSPVI